MEKDEKIHIENILNVFFLKRNIKIMIIKKSIMLKLIYIFLKL
jgi:hypothetical protein